MARDGGMWAVKGRNPYTEEHDDLGSSKRVGAERVAGADREVKRAGVPPPVTVDELAGRGRRGVTKRRAGQLLTALREMVKGDGG